MAPRSLPIGHWVCGHARSREMIETTVTEVHATGILTDPLTQFISQLESQNLDGATETVNLSGLLAAQGAALARPASVRPPSNSSNAVKECQYVKCIGRRRRVASRTSRRRVSLRNPVAAPAIEWVGDSADLRNHLESRGVPAITYDSGVVRFSMPRRNLPSDYLMPLRRALDIRRLSTRL